MMFPVWWYVMEALSQTPKNIPSVATHITCANKHHTARQTNAHRAPPSSRDTKREREESSGVQYTQTSNHQNSGSQYTTNKSLRPQALAAFLLHCFCACNPCIPSSLVPDSCRQSYAPTRSTRSVFASMCGVYVCVCVEVRVSLGVRKFTCT